MKFVLDVAMYFECTIALWLSLIGIKANDSCPGSHGDMKARVDIVLERLGISDVPLICVIKHLSIAKFLTFLIGL